ncbi:DUF6498-containing protein [Roseibacillus persicicus]|uniref:DUF6498-containing protein n=1 Tax=Roseibacillus persicicus TaxID=454148 RepID=UPI00280ED5E7|nr:DUF6498-containing protein [Roseibacillus persicicus]MDQ8191742.1 DUF6498-containing protein [Roseibacillus persicicus]
MMNWRWAQYFLAVAAAVAPLLGVFFWGWNAREVVLLYWIENIIIGFWQLMKMGAVGVGKVKDVGWFFVPGMLFTMAFFTIHYGGFCAGHGVFVLEMTNSGVAGSGAEGIDMKGLKFYLGPLLFVQLLFMVVGQAWAALPVASIWSVAAIFAMRGLGFVQDFILTGDWKRAEFQKLMFEPYKNIIALHVAIVFGAGLTLAFKGAWPVLAIIVVGKLVMDFTQIRKQEIEQGN